MGALRIHLLLLLVLLVLLSLGFATALKSTFRVHLRVHLQAYLRPQRPHLPQLHQLQAMVSQLHRPFRQEWLAIVIYSIWLNLGTHVKAFQQPRASPSQIFMHGILQLVQVASSSSYLAI